MLIVCVCICLLHTMAFEENAKLQALGLGDALNIRVIPLYKQLDLPTALEPPAFMSLKGS